MKIALSGYYGFDNAGDEALLSAITATIKRIEPSARFVVFSGYPGSTARLHGLRAVNRMNPWSVTRELRSSDLLISGGGSLFQDVTGPRSLPYYISIVALARLLHKPVIFYAQGIGPINRSLSKFLMRLIANGVNLITLRDEDSLTLLREIGVQRPPALVTADPVFTLEPEAADYDAVRKLLDKSFPPGSKIVGVAVRQWSPLEGYQQQLAAALDRLVRKQYQVLFIPLDYPDDTIAAYSVADLMTEKHLVLDKNLKSQEHIALMSNLQLVIGMRLHALIFAASQQIPFIGISYDPKIDSFLGLFGLQSLNTGSPDLDNKIDAILENETLRQQIRNKSLELKKKAEQTAYLALSLIDSKYAKNEES